MSTRSTVIIVLTANEHDRLDIFTEAGCILNTANEYTGAPDLFTGGASWHAYLWKDIEWNEETPPCSTLLKALTEGEYNYVRMGEGIGDEVRIETNRSIPTGERKLVLPDW